MRRFGTLGKLVRVTSWVVRFANNLKARLGNGETMVGSLKPQEITAAENVLDRPLKLV